MTVDMTVQLLNVQGHLVVRFSQGIFY